ncbi:hypothetical protein [Pseudomonas sp. BF-R-30]|uniref:hypothetical protein n=1 Tax=Pseudomonas sp. BF-R-30 TaxID=2832384 RepID=UPI001CBD07C6|nr:hypothetical protein [Pseudomonas sp. BF-R-30]
MMVKAKRVGLSCLTVKEFGFIGVLGVEQARQLGKRWAERKADEIQFATRFAN